MLTFLELYQTLLSFVFFKLYADVGLVYPPPLDAKKDENGAGFNALSLQDSSRDPEPKQDATTTIVEGRHVSGKVVRQTIKNINAASTDSTDVEMSNAEEVIEETEEEFVVRPSASDKTVNAALPTLQSLSTLPQTITTNLFSPYTFFLSRETPRGIFEFLVRSFGGRIGWPSSSGSGSPFEESDPNITHVIIDRPVVEKQESPDQRELRLRRKYVQPQWIADCINAGKILLEEHYSQGKTLPPHLSPFGEYEGAYIPSEEAAEGEPVEEEEEEEEDIEAAANVGAPAEERQATLDSVIAAATDDPTTLRAAELAAEAAGVDFGDFEAKVKKAAKKQKNAAANEIENAEQDMNKMMMSNKQRKLYEKMKYSNKKKDAEVLLFYCRGLRTLITFILQRTELESRKKELNKQKRK